MNQSGRMTEGPQLPREVRLDNNGHLVPNATPRLTSYVSNKHKKEVLQMRSKIAY